MLHANQSGVNKQLTEIDTLHTRDRTQKKAEKRAEKIALSKV